MQTVLAVLVGLVLSAPVVAEPLVEGQVRLSSGEPVEAAQIMVFDLADLRRGVVARATTDASGHFALPVASLGGSGVPTGFALGQNYPNPFNPSTVIPYHVPAAGSVRLEVFNVLGQRIATLVDEERPAGVHTAVWDATDAAGWSVGAGVYFYRLSSTGQPTLTRRMVLLDGQAGQVAASVPLPMELSPAVAAEGVYGLAVTGAGLVTYVDAAFGMRAGMAPVEVVVDAVGRLPRGKALTDGVLGDVNGDGAVNLADALLLVAYVSGESVELPPNGDISLGDVNGDGAVNLADALLLVAYVANPADASLPSGIGQVVTSSGGDLVAGAIRRLTNHSADDRSPSWSPDGRHIAFSSKRDGNREIYVMDSDGNNPRRLTNHSVDDRSPSWSPDGRHIAFYSYRYGNREIYVMDSDGNNPRRLTKHSANDYRPSWSPDGRHIVFSFDRDGNAEIYVMDSDGNNPRRLTKHPADDWSPSWSPDGRHIAFSSDRDGNTEIYVMDSDGNNPRRLTNHWAYDGSPSWSPDGRHIAFSSDRDDNWEIFVMDSDGNNPRRLTKHPADDGSPSWSPDGRHIAFSSDRDDNWEIFVMELWEDGTHLDGGDSPSGAIPLGLGEWIEDELLAGDIDYFRVSVRSAGRLVASTTGGTNTYGYIEDSSGNVLAEDGDGGSDRNFVVSAFVEPGTYYIRVLGARTSSTGAYALTLHLDGDYIPSGAIPLGLGESIEDELLAGDIDYFRVSVRSAGRLVASTTGGTDTYGYLEDSSGNVLAEDNDGGAGRNFVVSAVVEPGTYYIRVRGARTSDTGAYALTLQGAIPLGLGEWIEDELLAGDIDYFRVSVRSAGRLVASTTGGTNTYGYIEDSSGKVLAVNDDGGADLNFRVSAVVEPGTYYIRVRGARTSSTGAYTLTLHGAIPLGLGESIEDELSAREVDYFRVSVRSAGRLVASTTGDTDTYGYIEDSSGKVLAEDNDGRAGPNFRVSAVVEPGTYYIRVRGARTSSTGAYTLTLHGAIPLGLGESIEDELSADDIDYFRVSVRSAGRLVASTTGDTDTYGYIEDSSGNVLAVNDNGGAGSNFRVSAVVEPGTYYIRVVGAYTFSTGAYTLTLHLDGDHIPSGAIPLGLGESIEDELLAGDIDYFRVSVRSAGRLVASTTGGTDTYVYIEGSSGNVLDRSDDGDTSRNFRVSAVVEPGTYYIRVRGGRTSSTGAYTLTLHLGGDSPSGAIPLGLGESIEDELLAGDIAYFRVSVRSAGLLVASTTGGTDTYGYIEDSSGNVLDRSDDGGADHNFRVSAVVEPGTYYIRVRGGRTSSTGAYTLTLHLIESRHIDLFPGDASMTFVWIAPGVFQMGSGSPAEGEISEEFWLPDALGGLQWGDLRVHEVEISEGFWLGQYEVTQGQWEAVMGTTPWSGKRYVRENPSHPAIYISWDDVQSFIGRLNEAAGDSLYRLPSEAEWEYACRAGTSTLWSFGDDEHHLTDYAWYRDNAEYDARAVGLKRPNPWGLYDMHGNVWEWVQDWFDVDYYKSSPRVDPRGPSSGFYRVFRGGDFYNSAQVARSALGRGFASPDVRGATIGVRLLRIR